MQQKTLVLAAQRHGWGDCCVTSVIAENSRNLPVRLIHKAAGEMADFLRMLGQEVDTDTPEDECVDTFDAYGLYEIQSEQGSVPRVLSRARALGIELPATKPEDLVIPKVRISEAARDWAKAVVDEMRNFGHCKAVALWPQTVYPSREWPTGHWHDLAWALRFRGIGCGFFLGKDEERWHNVPSYVYGEPWEHWAALMEAVDLNVAISSGPASLAALLHARIIVLEGPTKPTIWWHAPHIETMQVGRDRISCVGCHFGAPYRGSCDFGCFALAALTPAEVLARVLDRLDVHSARDAEPLRLHHWPVVGGADHAQTAGTVALAGRESPA